MFRFNQHSIMVMKTAEEAGAPSEGTEEEISETPGQETVNTRKRILEKATYDDLEAPEAKRAAPLTLSKLDRYFSGPTPVASQDYLTQDELTKSRTNLQRELKIWAAQRNPNVLSSSAAVSEEQFLSAQIYFSTIHNTAGLCFYIFIPVTRARVVGIHVFLDCFDVSAEIFAVITGIPNTKVFHFNMDFQ